MRVGDIYKLREGRSSAKWNKVIVTGRGLFGSVEFVRYPDNFGDADWMKGDFLRDYEPDTATINKNKVRKALGV